MKLSEISIRKPVFAWMLMAGLLLFGILFFRQMGVSQYPDVDFPNVNIRVDFEGASPEVIEKDILEHLEGAVVLVEGIRSMTSSARTGQGRVSVEFGLDKDIDVAVQEIQSQLGRAQSRFPNDAGVPVVTKSNPDDRPILWLGVRTDTLSRSELMELVRDRIRDRFTTIPGIGEVMLGGYVDPALRVDLSAERLRNYQLSVNDILGTIQSEHIELPAGNLEFGDSETGIRVRGEAESVEEFQNLLIKRRGGSPNYIPLKLSDVADIREALADVRRISRVNGEASVGIGIRKQRGANSVEVADAAKKRAKEIAAELPEGVHIGVNFDSTGFIKESVDELIFTLILAALFTGLVCWFFLGSFTSTINILLAIPTSIIGSFIILGSVGYTLNSFTLLGLTLAIGIVVDDAIIVLENIMRHRAMGKSRIKAAFDASEEISFAVIATTLAVIAIFLPVAFMDGIIGKFFLQFAVAVSIAVALSSLEALTLTPMRCSILLNSGPRRTKIGRGIDFSIITVTAFYKRALEFLLNHRLKLIFATMALFFASLFILNELQREFAPEQDEGRIFIRMQTPEGSSLAYTDRKAKEVESWLMEQPYMDRYFVAVGGFGGGQVTSANIFVTLKEKRDLNQQEIAQLMREKFRQLEGVRAFVQGSSSSIIGGRRGFPVELSVRGPNWDQIILEAEMLSKKMEESGKFTDVNMDNVQGSPEILILPDRVRAQTLGVEISDISQTIRVLFGGVNAALYSQGGQRMDVRVQLRPEDRERMEDLSGVQVRNNRGELVALTELVQIRESSGPPTISREQRVRSVGIGANPAEGVSQEESLVFIQALARESLSEGITSHSREAQKLFQIPFEVSFLHLF
jgi:multidrug efflux pump subunit AcrB